MDAPHVAEIYKLAMARPLWQSDRPLAVDPELWRQASHELEEIMRRRGWAVAAANIDEPNFLLYGVPIVMSPS